MRPTVISMLCAAGAVCAATDAPAAADAGVEAAGAPRGAFTDLGPAPANTRVRLAVVLRYRDEPGLRAFVAAASRAALPAGARRTLDAATFRALYAPSQTAYAATLAALQARGLHIDATYANRTVIDVSGAPDIVNRTFDTQIEALRDRDGTVRYLNARPAYLPAELQANVYGVTGFDSRRTLQPAFRRAPHAIPLAVGPANVPVQGPDTGFSPTIFAKAYDFPVFHSTATRYDGSGRSAAIVIDADFLDSDLATYFKYFRIKPTGPAIVREPIGGGPPPGLSPDSIETELDLQTILGTSPGVGVTVYETAQLTYTDIIDAYDQIDTDDTVGFVNSSFGGCETQTTPSYFPQLSDYLAMQGAALGITFSASTGDGGASNVCGTGFVPDGVETPASDPTFVAVGGTTLFFNPQTGRYRFEFGWEGSGGGVSAVFPTPVYQTTIPNIIGKTRNLPDIAFDADPGSGESLYIGGQWIGPVGGTSLASPLFIGLAAQLAQYHFAALGDPHVPLYTTFTRSGYGKPALFHDITAGQNGYYNDLPGYDQVTGIGSIDGWNYATTGQI
jgi:pseudomonalisin/xanthomonalisin